MTTQTDTRLERLEREQGAFDAQLDSMMQDHEGEFVLFRDERPVAYFATYNEAYQAGLNQFGLDDVYIVSEVKRRDKYATSISWAAGVM
jgi:hypothetical protein